MILVVCSCLLWAGRVVANFVCPSCIPPLFHSTIPELPHSLPAMESIPGYTPIDSANVRTLTELSSVDTGTRNAVVALDIDSASGRVMAVTQIGRITQFPLAEPSKSITSDVGPVSLRSIAINAASGMLASSSDNPSNTPPDAPSHPPGYQWWEIHTWKVGSTLATTLTVVYNLSPSAILLPPTTKLLIESHGNQILAYEATSGKEVGKYWMANETRFTQIDAMVLDTTGEYIAVANINSAVAIVRLGSSGAIDDLEGMNRLESGVGPNGLDRDMKLKPLALAFDQARKQLALLRDNEAIVYDLGTFRQIFRATVTSSTGPAGSIAFDPSGQLLAVGTQDGWQIWDVAHSTKLFEQTGAGTYTVAFSADGRAFVWGDLDGHVHIWVARK